MEQKEEVMEREREKGGRDCDAVRLWMLICIGTPVGMSNVKCL